MRDIVSAGDVTYIQQQYPEENIKKPTPYQQQVILMYLRGMNPPAIAKAMGNASLSHISQYIRSSSCQAITDFLRANEFVDIRATREYLTNLMFLSYHKSATATEEIMALREIGKLNGLYESDKMAKNVTINQIGNIQNVKQLEKMSEEQLIAMVHEPVTATIENPPQPYQGEEPCEEAL